jgi:transmembrane sensor
MTMREPEQDSPQSVSDQAAEWFIRLRDRDLGAAERRRYVRWLKQSPNHIAEFMRTCRMYGRVKRAGLPTPPEMDASNVVSLMESESPPFAEESQRGLFESRPLRYAAFACGLALMGVIASFVLASNTIETQASEWRSVQLADGTTVSAGPNTLIKVEYSRGTRGINLRRGEAMFKVAKDASRPFIVNAEGALARAVGTRFGVERRKDRVRVTVAEGRVAVVGSGQAAALEHEIDLSVATSLVADEGVEIRLDTPSAPLRVEKVNSANALAWANGQLVLQTQTVGEAVEEFNRRNRLQLRVDDAEIARWHLCCVFDAADPEAFARRIVASGENISLVREGDTLRVVRQAPGQATPTR